MASQHSASTGMRFVAGICRSLCLLQYWRPSMNQPYDPPRRDQSGPADLAGFLVLGGCAVLGVFWYIAVSRLYLRSDECLEIFLDLVIGIFGIALLLSHLIGRRAKREEMWPHSAVAIPGARDAAIVEAAIRNEATVLGYNVHK